MPSPILRASLACCLATTACTTTIAGVPISIPDPTSRVPSGGTASTTQVIRVADDYVGVPYKWGGTSPRTGFDCSGYTQYVYAREGVQLPRTSRQQAVAGTRRATRWDAARAGDLVMFAEPGQKISHVAFYAGNGRILHSSSSGGGVRYDDLGTSRGRWFRTRLVAVRHVSDRGPAIARGLLAELGLTNAPLDPPDKAPRPR